MCAQGCGCIWRTRTHETHVAFPSADKPPSWHSSNGSIPSGQAICTLGGALDAGKGIEGMHLFAPSTDGLV
jgi:hypothetical protein